MRGSLRRAASRVWVVWIGIVLSVVVVKQTEREATGPNRE